MTRYESRWSGGDCPLVVRGGGWWPTNSSVNSISLLMGPVADILPDVVVLVITETFCDDGTT